MESIRRYQDITHNHSHLCPSCEEPLDPEDNGYVSDQVELHCSTTNCSIRTCYCNGTLEQATITLEEYARCLNDILTELPSGVSLDPLQFNQLSDITEKVQDLISVADLEKPDDDYVNSRLEVMEEIEKALTRRDLSGVKQHKKTGERMEYLNGVYIPWSEVMLYSVLSDESSGVQIVQVPSENYSSYSEDDVEPWDLQIIEELSNSLKDL